MTGQDEDRRLELELREVIRRRDPGAAPYGLRRRVDLVPQDAPAGRSRSGLSRVAPLVAAAAVLVVAVVGAQLVGFAPAPGPGASTTPVTTPPSSFDPRLVGPGVMAQPAGDPAGAVALGVLLLVLLAVMAPRRWRILPAGVAIALAAYAVVASQIPVTLRESGFGQGLATMQAQQPPASEEEILYVTADAGEPFSVGLFLSGESAVPVTLEAIIDDHVGDFAEFGFPTWQAVWFDEQGPTGGMTGPGTPFEPIDVEARSTWSLWLVGRAGMCSYGSTFAAPEPGGTYSFTNIDRVQAQVRVLGWPRTIEVALPFRLAEPQGSCPP